MAGPIRIAILANGRQARSEAALTARAYGSMGRSVSRTAKLIGGAFAVGSLVRAAAAVERIGGSYVGSLNKIQALTGANSRQIDRAAQTIESGSAAYSKMGQTAGDAAGGVVELTKSGLSLGASLKSVHATMVLAKAGELEVADASTLVANTLNTFSLKAGAASKIANGLANAANISSADVSDLAESFKYASPLAAKAGLSLAQVDAILAELSNSGIKASQAGTSLRGILLGLQAPSTAGGIWLQDMGVKVYGAGGKMRDFGDILADLRAGIGKLSEEDQNFALKSIFGKNSITGASVLLKNGKKGLDEYTKGVKRAGAAQKLANAASKGLDGTLKSIKASATSSAEALYRQYSPALNARLKSVLGYLSDNKDEMTDLATAAGQKLAPAISTVTGLAKSAATALKDTAIPIAKDLLPAVEGLANLAMDAADAVNELPDPVKQIGIQAAIAALILPRLSAGITSVTGSLTLNIARLQQWRAEMTYAETRAQSTAATMQRLGSAARAAAGIGGLVLLAQSSKQADGSLKLLGDAASGALIGFSVAGAPGAVIGTAAGALYGLATATSQAAVETVTAKDNTKAYVDTLNELTGASTRATRARIFDRLSADKGTLALMEQSGVAARDIVSAVMGQSGAWTRLQGALAKARTEYNGLKNPQSATGRALQRQIFALKNLVPTIRGESSALATSIQATKDKADAVTNWGKALHGVPPEVRAEIKNQNYDLTRKQVDQLVEKYKLVPTQKRTILQALGADAARTKAQRALDAYAKLPHRIQTEVREVGGGETVKRLKQIAREYKLTPRQVRLLIRATGAEATVKQVGGVRKAIESTGKVKVSNKWLADLRGALTQGASQATRGGKGVKKGIEGPIAQTRPDLSSLLSGINTGLGTAKRSASKGGNAVGSNLKSGIITGFAGTGDVLAAQAAAAVHRAVAAARAAGDIHSPSKKMRDRVGRPLAQGIIQGFIHEAKDGESGVKSALNKLMGVIEDRLDGKKQAGRRKSILKSLADERFALRLVGFVSDQNNKALDKALDKYKQLKQRADQFAASIRSGYKSYGSVIGLGTLGGGTTVTSDALISQLTARAQVADRFATIIDKLRGKLNKTSLKQILDTAASGDLEGALATAQAISSGGAGAISQINQLTSQISQAGGKLGNQMRHDFYGAGLQAADGLVEGLKKRQKQLDAVAERLAKQLVAKVKKALGIHSPSRVFAQIGSLTADGLTVGIKARDTHVRRSGSDLATSLRKGFGTPALDAYMSSSSSSPSAPTFTVQIELTAQQLSEIEKGRKIQVSLDAYQGAGGRSKVRSK